MKRLKNITILLCFLSLLAFISCSAEDKTGVKDNPPEDTEIVDGETETPTSPSEPETPPSPSDGIEEGDFPPPAGKYKSDDRRWEGLVGSYYEPKVSTIGGKTTIDGDLILHDSNIENGKYESLNAEFNVSKWRQTTKDGKITKTEAVEIEAKILVGGRYETPTFTKVIYDYETKTLSITCKVTIDGSEKTLSTKSEKY